MVKMGKRVDTKIIINTRRSENFHLHEMRISPSSSIYGYKHLLLSLMQNTLLQTSIISSSTNSAPNLTNSTLLGSNVRKPNKSNLRYSKKQGKKQNEHLRRKENSTRTSYPEFTRRISVEISSGCNPTCHSSYIPRPFASLPFAWTPTFPSNHA